MYLHSVGVLAGKKQGILRRNRHGDAISFDACPVEQFVACSWGEPGDRTGFTGWPDFDHEDGSALWERELPKYARKADDRCHIQALGGLCCCTHAAE